MKGTGCRSGAAPVNAPATEAAQAPAATDVYAAMDAQASEEIQRIVRANAGGVAKPVGK